MEKHDPVEVMFHINEKGEMNKCKLEGNIGSILTGFAACIAYFDEKTDKSVEDMLEFIKGCVDKLQGLE